MFLFISNAPLRQPWAMKRSWEAKIWSWRQWCKSRIVPASRLVEKAWRAGCISTDLRGTELAYGTWSFVLLFLIKVLPLGCVVIVVFCLDLKSMAANRGFLNPILSRFTGQLIYMEVFEVLCTFFRGLQVWSMPKRKNKSWNRLKSLLYLAPCLLYRGDLLRYKHSLDVQ